MRNLILIGASAGGIPAIKKLLAGLPKLNDAAVFVVQHVSWKSDIDAIAYIFQKQTSLTCLVAKEGLPIKKGHLYLAPPNHHLILEQNVMHITEGPHENRYRPSIDVLFRSAAVSFGNQVIAVILTGMLEDGTSGMAAVKRTGGICIVQDPSDAEFGSMPTSALTNEGVDYQASLSEIPQIIETILSSPLPPEIPVPRELQIEADITKRMMSNIDDLKKIADRSDFVCPDCGGGLWAIKNDPAHRYRCHTGHVYTEKLLCSLQDEKIEESLWVCIRMLEEKGNLLKVMLSRQNENDLLHGGYLRRIKENELHIKRLKMLLQNLVDASSDEPNQSAS